VSLASAEPADDLGELVFSPGVEEWVEFGPPEARRRIGFHDYAALYAVPGLYERLFYEELGMRSTFEVSRMFAAVLGEVALDPAEQRVLDLGAGNGAGAQELRRLGVGHVVGLDLEPAAREATLRDRPGTYDDYLVGDLTAWSQEELADARARRLSALVAHAAIGVGHVPPLALERALGLLEPGALFAFAVAPALLPGSDDAAAEAAGYHELLADLLEHRGEELARHAYVHRRRADGSDDLAVAIAGRLRA
jgi:SAM-dependent methyltransferase